MLVLLSEPPGSLVRVADDGLDWELKRERDRRQQAICGEGGKEGGRERGGSNDFIHVEMTLYSQWDLVIMNSGLLKTAPLNASEPVVRQL